MSSVQHDRTLLDSRFVPTPPVTALPRCREFDTVLGLMVQAAGMPPISKDRRMPPFGRDSNSARQLLGLGTNGRMCA